MMHRMKCSLIAVDRGSVLSKVYILDPLDSKAK